MIENTPPINEPLKLPDNFVLCQMNEGSILVHLNIYIVVPHT